MVCKVACAKGALLWPMVSEKRGEGALLWPMALGRFICISNVPFFLILDLFRTSSYGVGMLADVCLSKKHKCFCLNYLKEMLKFFLADNSSLQKFPPMKLRWSISLVNFANKKNVKQSTLIKMYLCVQMGAIIVILKNLKAFFYWSKVSLKKNAKRQNARRTPRNSFYKNVCLYAVKIVCLYKNKAIKIQTKNTLPQKYNQKNSTITKLQVNNVKMLLLDIFYFNFLGNTYIGKLVDKENRLSRNFTKMLFIIVHFKMKLHTSFLKLFVVTLKYYI